MLDNISHANELIPKKREEEKIMGGSKEILRESSVRAIEKTNQKNKIKFTSIKDASHIESEKK